MIEMPSRSVTRFFVPFIDVMLLMFSLFLLLPIADTESENGDQSTKPKQKKQTVEELTKQIKKLDETVELLQKQMKALQTKTVWAVQEDTRHLHFNEKTRQLEYYDEKNPLGPTVIKSKADADSLFARLGREAGGKTLFYVILVPTRQSDAGLNDPELKYLARLLGDVPNSLFKKPSK